MSGDTKRVLEVNQIDNLQGSTQRVKQENTLNNLRGVTQRVYVVGGGGSAVINPLSVTPSTSAQTITATAGVDGYSPVSVSAVDSTIDANITAGNIKDGVSILGVTGNYKGNTPTGTMYIISNGTYNVADKAIANVNVPTAAPASYRAFQKDGNGKLVNSTSTPWVSLPAGTTDLDAYVLYQAYKNTPANILSGALDLSSLTAISGVGAISCCFSGCTGITSANLSSLTTVSGSNAMASCFANCTGISSVNLSSLTTISGSSAVQQCFYGCTGLTSLSFSALTNITGYGAMQQCFYGCTGLTSLSFPALTSASFGAQTTQFNNMLLGVTGCTVHFPSNVQAKVETLTGYPNFGGTNTTVLFDLPATE